MIRKSKPPKREKLPRGRPSKPKPSMATHDVLVLDPRNVRVGSFNDNPGKILDDLEALPPEYLQDLIILRPKKLEKVVYE